MKNKIANTLAWMAIIFLSSAILTLIIFIITRFPASILIAAILAMSYVLGHRVPIIKRKKEGDLKWNQHKFLFTKIN